MLSGSGVHEARIRSSVDIARHTIHLLASYRRFDLIFLEGQGVQLVLKIMDIIASLLQKPWGWVRVQFSQVKLLQSINVREEGRFS